MKYGAFYIIYIDWVFSEIKYHLLIQSLVKYIIAISDYITKMELLLLTSVTQFCE
jgi:hypothetical protein